MSLRTSLHFIIIIAFPIMGYSSVGKAKPISDWIRCPTHYSLCGGYYQEPIYPYPLLSKAEEAKLPFKLSADSAEVYVQGTSHLEGSVSITQGNKQLQADSVSFVRENNEIQKIEGGSNLIFTQPDIRVEADSGLWDPLRQILEVNTVDYRYYPKHARGHADKGILCDSKLKLYNASYTTCAPCSNAWELSSKCLTLDKTTGRGQSQHTLFKLAGFPVFYWPYLDFPIDSKRHSGFLAPRASSTSNSGFELALPFYWNISPQYDYLIVPRILSERGVDFQNKVRYLTPQAQGHINFNFLPHDKAYPEEKLNRIKLNIVHEHRLHKNWKGNIDFNYVGDNNYFIDLEQDLDNASITKLLQEFELSYASLNWNHIFHFERYQILYPQGGPRHRDDYHRQPEWAFHALYPQQAYGLTFELDGAFTQFAHSKNRFDGRPFTTGQRYQLRPGLSLPIQQPGYFFKPRLQIDWLKDDLDLNELDVALDKPSHLARTIPLMDVNMGLIFEKNYNKSYRQTFEPQLYYLYVPYVDQSNYPNFDSGYMDFSYYQEFRDNRFSGRDRVGDTNQLTTAFSSRIYNPENEELLRFNLGEVFYFSDRKVTLNGTNELCYQNKSYSDLALNLELYPNKNWSVSTGLEWNPTARDISKSYVSFQYLPGIGKVINLDYYWMKCDPTEAIVYPFGTTSLHQMNASFTWPVHKKLNLLGQVQYDFEQERVITMLTGMEYESCCFAYQIVGSRYLKPNNGITTHNVYENGLFFQIVFKGLTTLSFAAADKQLTTAIPGYHSFTKKINDRSRHSIF